MQLPDTELIIAKTKKWIIDVVVGCNFCPFAGREVKKNSIHYDVLHHASPELALQSVMHALQQLDENEKIETSLLILSGSYESFDDYLDLVDMVNNLLLEEDYEGIYQVASFHPQYLFAGSNNDDPSNYTNRSPYPMLHFLREDSVSKAVDSYPDIDEVPNRNIAFTQEKGLHYMIRLLGN